METKNQKFINKQMAVVAAVALLNYFTSLDMTTTLYCSAKGYCNVVVHNSDMVILPTGYVATKVEYFKAPDMSEWLTTFMFSIEKNL